MNIEVSALKSSSVLSAMTPRDNIVFLDLNEGKDSICRKIALHPHGKYPVCKNSMDTVIGYADISSLRTRTGTDKTLSLRSGHIVRKPLLIFATLSLFGAIEQFRDTRQDYALVVNKDSRCSVPVFDGTRLAIEWKESLWASFYMAAPPRQRLCVEQYKIVKRA